MASTSLVSDIFRSALRSTRFGATECAAEALFQDVQVGGTKRDRILEGLELRDPRQIVLVREAITIARRHFHGDGFGARKNAAIDARPQERDAGVSLMRVISRDQKVAACGSPRTSPSTRSNSPERRRMNSTGTSAPRSFCVFTASRASLHARSTRPWRRSCR